MEITYKNNLEKCPHLCDSLKLKVVDKIEESSFIETYLDDEKKRYIYITVTCEHRHVCKFVND